MKGFVKITYEMEDEEILNVIPQNVKTKLKELTDTYKENLINSLINCESPIEQLMSLELTARLEKYFTVNSYLEVLGFCNQEVIECKDKKYRVDFLIEIAFKKQSRYFDVFKLVIECDGHDFHEKTKEQVRKDNEKNRNLQSEGYEVLRFSGSEIYNNVNKCATEIIKFIHSKYYIALEKQV